MAGPSARFGLFFTSVLLHSALAEDLMVTPTAEVVGKQTNSTDVSSVPGQPLPFKQLTHGSTPQGWMQLGTPPKWLKVIFDTGSDKLVAKTWSTVSAELTTLDQGLDGMVMPTDLLYDHNASSSYVHKMMKDPLTGKEGPTMSMIAYGSGDAVTEEGIETVIVGTRQLENFSISEISTDSLQLLHTSKGIAGILGLQHMMNKSLGTSVFSKMREAKLMTSFGYCRGSNNSGTFIWGDDSKEGVEIPVIGQMHWAVTLQNVKVASDANSSSLLAKGKKQIPHFAGTATRTSRYRQRHVHANKHHSWQQAWPFGGPGGDAPQDIGGGGGAGGFGGSEMGGGDQRMGGDGDGDGGNPFGGNPFGMGGDGDGDGGEADGDAGQGVFGGDGDGDAMPSHEFDQGNNVDAIEMSKKHMCNEWNCTAILDTGSNIIAGPTKALTGIIAQINVKNDCSNLDQLPPLTFNLGGHPVTVHPESYVMKIELPPGMNVMGGDGSGDGSGSASGGDPIFGDDDNNADNGAGRSDDGDAEGSGAGAGCGGGGCGGDMGDASGGGGDMGGASGGCGGGGGCGSGGGGMQGLDTYSKERVGVRMPSTVHIGIPADHGRRSIDIEINRHEPQQQQPEGHVRSSLQRESASLEQHAVKKANHRQHADKKAKHRSSATARWRSLLTHMKKDRGIDLITALRELLHHENGTEAQFLCMPALVPLDKHTPFGPLWIVGTPFLEEYYGRYSFGHDDQSPKFNFKPLKDAKTCQNLQVNASSPMDNSTSNSTSQLQASSRPAASRQRMMRSEQTASSKPEQQAERVRKGPVIRTLDEISYPHWAKSLLKI